MRADQRQSEKQCQDEPTVCNERHALMRLAKNFAYERAKAMWTFGNILETK